MRLLVVGGSGKVGTFVLPYLAAKHEVRVFDLKPPDVTDEIDYVGGDVRDFDALYAATEERDALVYMAMGPMAEWGSPDNARAHFDVAAGGLYLALRAAHERGISHAVYTSSMSVFSTRSAADRLARPHYPDETQPTDATGFYGLAKRFGELVCENAVLEWGMSVVALRLCFPVADAEFPITSPPSSPDRALICTSARDVGRAILAGLDYRGHGFEAFGISGDAADRMVSIAKAREVLGWEPLDQTP